MGEFSDLLRQILEKRGIKDKKEADIFLNPDYDRDMHDPFLFSDMERACERLYRAIKENEKVVIYADYDADGIPGAVVLNDLFQKINFKNYEVYIPERNSEGYGLNIEAIETFKEKSVNLIITIDLGITGIEEVDLANSCGIDVIITDHHLPKENIDGSLNLPNAYAILNPKVVYPDEGGNGYPEKMLCGAGVMFKFVQGFLKYVAEVKSKVSLPAELATLKKSSATETFISLPPTGWEKWLLDMAGLATLSDMVPLLGENRTIAYFGLKVLRKSPRPGLQRLLKKMSIEQKYITEDDIGYMLTPRLNAASRMDSPMRAFELLATKDEKEAGVLADHLTKINDDRKNTVLHIMKEVKKNFEKREVGDVVVMGNPSWKVGVLGLVAGKIMDSHNKPVFIWGKDENNIIKGSCRSPGSVSVVELMSETKEYFLEYGGHELAGGFSVHTDKIFFLEEALSENFHKIKKENNKKEQDFDVVGNLSLFNMRNYKEIEKMAPFGLSNPKPIFYFPKVLISKIRKFGKNNSKEHMEIIFVDKDKNNAKAISFFKNENSFSKKITEGISVDLYANFDLSYFAGKTELRLRIVDIV